MSASLSLLVLRCADPTASMRFYSQLGFVFEEERHDRGPVHYSARLGDTVLELYPAGHRSGTVRMQVVVPAGAYDAMALRAEAHAPPHPLVLEDPDRNQLELVRATTRVRELATAPEPLPRPDAPFSLWLEFENWVSAPEDDPEDEFFNMTITLGDGTKYALNVWTFGVVDSLRKEAARTGENLRGRYLDAPDLFVARMERPLLESVVADMIANKALKDEWLVRVESDAGDEME
ncbi:MAG: hypothetical protein HOW73_22640 [Polyangiaceae bacterium]|nr:hypothetical protein [Polyangiaceae bacterium]